MADEEVVVAAETTTSVSNSDNHKRKFEDLELAAPSESVRKGEALSDSAENLKAEVKEGEIGENEAHVDGSEAKRLRLEEKLDDIGAENGHMEEKKRGESKEDDTIEKPPCLDNNIQLVNGPEVDDIHTEEKKGHESEVDYSGEKPASLDHCRQLDDGPKVDNEAQETTISEQLAPINDLETSDVQESNNNDELQKYYNTEEPCKGEDHEPSSCLPQQAGAPNDQDKNIALETQTVSHILEVPNNKVGVIIGKGGETIRNLQFNSGSKIQITRDSDSDPHSTTRPVELIGTLDSVVKAEKLIKDVIAEADAGGSPSLVAKGFNPVQSVVGDQIEMKVPIEKVGLIIGKSGETIKNLQARSGARIQLVQLPDGEQVKERTVRVTGERKQIERAQEMIQEVMDQRVRASPVSMGYSQQAFHMCGPVAPQWGTPPYGPVQNPCYDSRQRGPYPSPSPQQHPTPVYGNYPSHQPPHRSGFGPCWEQRLPSPMQQVPPPPPQANYNYGQPQPFYPQHQPQPHGQNYGHPGQMPPPMTSQQMAAYPSQGGFTGDQYGKPPSYGLMMQQQAQASHAQQHYSQQPQASHVQQQHYSQQPPYMASSHGYGVNMQQYPYPSTGGPMQQAYLAGTPCGPAAPSGDGYSQHPQQSSGPVYPQQQQPHATYAAAAAQIGQQPPAATAYGSSYPSQPPADNSIAGYGYQAQPPPTDPYGGSSISHQSTAATYNAQSCYAQLPPPATHTGYDQSVAQSGGYVVTQPTTQAAAATSYGSSA